MPEPGALKPDLDLSPTRMVKNGVQTVMPHMTSDYTKELRHTGDARQQTIQHLHGYTATSRDSLDALKMMVRAARHLGWAALAASVCRMSSEGHRSALRLLWVELFGRDRYER